MTVIYVDFKRKIVVESPLLDERPNLSDERLWELVRDLRDTSRRIHRRLLLERAALHGVYA